MKTFREWNVEQRWLFPPSVLEFVPPGHLAHFLRETVSGELDLTAILATYNEERGYPPYHPVMMTALLLYAYCQGTYSSRRIAKACVERVDFMAVTGMQQPDFRTVSEFRRRHLASLGAIFEQVLRLCRRAGLVQLGHVALDGTKVAANASKRKAMSYKRMKQAEQELKKQIADWFSQAEAIDEAEDREFGAGRTGEELPDWVANKQKRLEKIRQAKAELEAEARAKAKASKDKDKDKDHHPRNGAARSQPASRRPWKPDGTPRDHVQRNFTDPESRILKTSEGYAQGYNALLAVDAKRQIIVACNVVNEQNEARHFDPMLAQIKSHLGRQAQEVSADSAYCSEANLRAARRRHLRVYIAVGRQMHGHPVQDSRKPIPAGTLRAAMRSKLARGGYRSRYRLRKQTVEPVIGQIKEARGFRRFLLRGLSKVWQEWSLLCTAHNLLKLGAATT